MDTDYIRHLLIALYGNKKFEVILLIKLLKDRISERYNSRR